MGKTRMSEANKSELLHPDADEITKPPWPSQERDWLGDPFDRDAAANEVTPALRLRGLLEVAPLGRVDADREARARSTEPAATVDRGRYQGGEI
jgi:hypothetical protein